MWLLYIFRVERRERARLKNVKFQGKSAEKGVSISVSVCLNISAVEKMVIKLSFNGGISTQVEDCCEPLYAQYWS